MTDKQYLISLSILLLIPVGATIYFYLWSEKQVRETEKIYGIGCRNSNQIPLCHSLIRSVILFIKNKISH